MGKIKEIEWGIPEDLIDNISKLEVGQMASFNLEGALFIIKIVAIDVER